MPMLRFVAFSFHETQFFADHVQCFSNKNISEIYSFKGPFLHFDSP